MRFASLGAVLYLAKTNPATRTNKLLNLTTGGLLGAITLAALNLSDLSFVLSFGGATLGNAIIFVFPALMFRAAVKKAGRKDLEVSERSERALMKTRILAMNCANLATNGYIHY